MEKESFIKRLSKNKTAQLVTGTVFVLLVILGTAYWKINSSRVYIDKSDVQAPQINLAPTAAGIVQHILVNVGDRVDANTVVAQVGNELLKTQTAGIIVSTNNSIGTLAAPGQTIVSMIDPSRLRVIGHVDEDKGLSDIHIGEPAVFTIDAFGSKQFNGVVDEVSSTARSTDVVFSISDKRPTQVFDVKIRFDQSLYPDIKNGMSARLWIYKQ
ncbi:MAG: efflux RND transporter periplasmic adaptor subunit [bacterium]